MVAIQCLHWLNHSRLGGVMNKASQRVAGLKPREAVGFNYNKLQAVACILCSSAVSVGAIIWLYRMF
jgi:hypothetical protein